MSLLIDALKQAELARQQAEAENADQMAFALEPLPAEETEADVTAPEAAPLPPPVVAKQQPEKANPREVVRQQAARELFEVKQPTPSRLPLLAAIIALCVMVVGGLYVWWSLQPRGLQPGPALAQANTVPPVTTPAPPPLPAPSVRQAPSESAGQTTREEQAVLPARPTVERSVQSSVQGSTLALRDGNLTQAVEPTTAVNIRRGGLAERDAQLSQTLQEAYLALTRGAHEQAHSLYQEVLRVRPRNVDALNGLGSLALKAGDVHSAERYFRAALEADPSDAPAQAYLLQLRTATNLPEAEARARELVANQPQSATAHFALGNLLGKQSRWSEAQQAYFQAYTLEPDNPDVLFNLAVSLEHLGQKTLARQMYAQAALAAQQRPAAFTPSQASQRADALAAKH